MNFTNGARTALSARFALENSRGQGCPRSDLPSVGSRIYFRPGSQSLLTSSPTKVNRPESGLTLVEILVASTLLVLITLGLMLMFDQAQRAFRGGVKQVDVLEGGRAALELIARDFDHLTDGGLSVVTNFSAKHASGLDLIQLENDNTTPFRTNRVYDVFTLAHINNDWLGMGYVVTQNMAGLGSLHRFVLTNWSRDMTSNYLHQTFTNQIGLQNYQSNFHRVIDGVVHFQVNVLDANGRIINRPDTTPSQGTISYPYGTTNLPSALELELGILEPQTVEQVRGMPQPAQAAFLSKRPDKVHIFRRQIPIRPAR